MAKSSENSGKRAYRSGAIKEYGTVNELVGFTGSGAFDDGGGAIYSS